MKFSQICALVATLVVSLAVVMWLASTVPAIVFEDDKPATNDTNNDNEPPAEDSVEQTNPFDLTTEGPHPTAVLEEELFNFGEMALEETGTHAFVIKNEGDVELKLAKGPVQCKCTISGLKQEMIPPGGEASIELEYTPKALGEFGQGAIIWTNDPMNPELRIRVEGKMVSALEISPDTGWNLGTVSDAGPLELLGDISSSIETPFDITSIETSSDAVKIEAVPLTEEDKERLNAKTGYHLIGSYHPSEESGNFLESITIHTTHEKKPIIEFKVKGNRPGPISIIGPGWNAGTRSLNLGRIGVEEAHTQRLVFMVEPTEEEVKFTKTETSPSFIKASVKAEENAPDAARHRFTFIVEIPKGSPKGIWNLKKPGEITLKTNHPKLGVININLQMIIQ